MLRRRPSTKYLLALLLSILPLVTSALLTPQNVHETTRRQPPVFQTITKLQSSRQGSLSKSTATTNPLPPYFDARRRRKGGNSYSHKYQPNSKLGNTGRSEARKRNAETFTIPDTFPMLSEVLHGKPFNETLVTELRQVGHQTAPLAASNEILIRTRKQNIAKQSKQTTTNQSQNVSDRIPWKAGYYTSIKTQRRIQRAARDEQHQSSHPPSSLARATRVLQAFWSIPPERCNAANLVCALTLSAKLLSSRSSGKNSVASALFRKLFFQTTDVLQQLVRDDQLSSRQLCNAIWAIGKHVDRYPELLPPPVVQTALSTEHVRGRAEKWDLRSLYNGKGDPSKRLDETIDKISARLIALLQLDTRAVKEAELCMASWAYGILRPRNRPPGWKHGPRMGQVPGDSLSSASPAALISSSPDLIQFESWIQDDADEPEDGDGPDNVTGLLFDAVAHALAGHDRIRQCKWSEMANVAWAFASHGRSNSAESQTLLMSIADEATRRLRYGSEPVLSRDIAQIAWSIGTLQSDNFRLGDGLVRFMDAVKDTISAISPKPSRLFEKWSSADIVQVVLALAHARIDDLELLKGLYEEAVARLAISYDEERTPTVIRKSFRTWEISILLWAQARLYLTLSLGEMFVKFTKLAVQRIATIARGTSTLEEAGMGSQEGANIAWSLTVLQESDSPDARYILARIFDDASTSCQATGVVHLEHAHQLWQAIFLLEEESPEAVQNVSPLFYEYLRSKWNLEKSRRKESSARHRALSQTLKLMGVAHKNEHDEDIDVAIVLKADAVWTHESDRGGRRDSGVKVAVEFDGPNHFTRAREPEDGSKPPPPRPLGHTVLKYRLLKKQGWTVVRVPYYEFDKIPFWASMERQRYLQRLLKTHGNLRFSQIDVSEYKAPVSNRKSRFD